MKVKAKLWEREFIKKKIIKKMYNALIFRRNQFGLISTFF